MGYAVLRPGLVSASHEGDDLSTVAGVLQTEVVDGQTIGDVVLNGPQDSVVVEQLGVFRNARKGKTSVWDIWSFFILPIILASIIVFGIGKPVDNDLANILTTVFSLIFTILFGFIAILVGRMEDDSNNRIEQTVIKETFVSIISATLISLAGTITSIIITQIQDGVAKSVISCVIYSIAFIDVMFLLMTTKRIFKIYCERYSPSPDHF